MTASFPGPANGKWRGGTTINNTKNGKAPYLRITSGPQRGRYVHELVMEGMLGRELTPDEEVDHKDTDGLNPKWTNLELVSHAENMRRMQARKKAKKAADKLAKLTPVQGGTQFDPDTL